MKLKLFDRYQGLSFKPFVSEESKRLVKELRVKKKEKAKQKEVKIEPQ
jgi:hypothetical protein